MQLRWHHQFQFAGYYAAKAKGFYREEGLDVEIVSGSPQRQPVTEVLAGRAQYAVGNSEVLYSRLKGEPLVALAVIYQHSPSVLLSLASSGLRTPRDLIGATVMTVGGEADADFLAMLRRQNVAVDAVNLINSSYQIQDLVDGKVQAFNSYLTNEPFFLEERGIAYNIINPRDYGIDFYSDILFTTERELAINPKRVARFKRATIRGWEYALAHPEEIIHLIHDDYDSNKSMNHMRFEALSVQGLIMPELVEIGYINPLRMTMMAEVFLAEGMVDRVDRLEGFVHIPVEPLPQRVVWTLLGVAVFLVAALLLAALLAMFNRRLQVEIQERKLVEDKLNELANTDSLTQLLNRRAFQLRYSDELNRAQRYGDVFSIILLDIDFFKRVNDQHGHDAGDRVLQALSALLRKNTRESDSCARFGGEEFILLLPKTAVGEAQVYANRLREQIAVNQVSLASGHCLTVEASMGVAQWQEGQQDEATIMHADQALYQAKERGRNQVVVWQSGEGAWAE